MSPKLVSAEHPFALVGMVWHDLNAVDPWHPFDDLLFVSPKAVCSLYRYVHVYLSAAGDEFRSGCAGWKSEHNSSLQDTDAGVQERLEHELQFEALTCFLRLRGSVSRC